MHHSNNAKMGVSVIFLGNRVSIGTQFYFFVFLFLFFAGETIAVVYEHTKRTQEILFADLA